MLNQKTKANGSFINRMIVVLGLMLLWNLAACNTETTELNNWPELLWVTGSEALVAWVSDTEYRGEIFFRSAQDEQEQKAEEENIPSRFHEIMLKGLSSNTSYFYRLKNEETSFMFQTQPDWAESFSFLIASNIHGDDIMNMIMSEMSHFVISLDSLSREKSMAPVRAFVPVLTASGQSSPFQETLQGSDHYQKINNWFYDWGGLRLIFINKPDERIGDLLKASQAHTIGVVINSQVLGNKEEVASLLTGDCYHLPFYEELTIFNQDHPSQKASFVLISGVDRQFLNCNDIVYLSLGDEGLKSALRVDIDVEYASAYFLYDDEEVSLKELPMNRKLTCEECRHLADKGAYEKSINAYQDFIAQNQGHFQIDDAYYAIADIYDEKLFQLEDALNWYQRLLKEYPASHLASLATQRIYYLETYKNDFVPLSRFDRIRKIEMAKTKGEEKNVCENLRAVEEIIREYHDSPLAPVMKYWVAKQYKLFDADQAILVFKELEENYPGALEAQEIALDIGDTLYEAGRYYQAKEAYVAALDALPDLEATIKAQLLRSERNINRRNLAIAAWFLVILTMGVSIFSRPLGFDGKSLIFALLFFIIFGIIVFFAAWLIWEQFTSESEMILLVIFFSFAAAAGVLFSKNIYHKYVLGIIAKNSSNSLVSGNNLIMGLLVVVKGLVLFLSAWYLSIFHINEHLLVAFGF
ncbi:MAG: hypothetical protein JXR70_17725 [Spirochaetales bacterium]|nr:hypothetical protein [Spirochaetales bacterium]